MSGIQTSPAGSDLKRARQMLEQGLLPPVGWLSGCVRQSWQRSLQVGLKPFGAARDMVHLDGASLRQAQERQPDLVRRARPVLEYLHAQTRGAGGMVLLGNDQGVVLDALGDADFLSRAQRVALSPGASWHEHHRGTNAIGTALAEGAAVTVHGGEHFLEHHGFLTCSAAPILGPDGRVCGVLDMSGHRRSRHPHTAALVLSAAHMIENRLLLAACGDHYRLHLHPQPDGIGTLAEGLLTFDLHGTVLAANRAAMALLGLAGGPGRLGHIEECLDVRLDHLLAFRPLAAGDAVLRTRHGRELVVRLHHPSGWVSPHLSSFLPLPETSAPTQPRVQTAPDALAELERGDPAMAALLVRIRKVMDKPIPLLLQGETGVGKDRLAQAVHQVSQRRGKPFVALNCAALPESMIEAELFGYVPGAFTGAARQGATGRIREAHGGTLFLDEIGDMPLTLQARLLRVLQDRQVVPLGGGKPCRVDFHLIAATHCPLKKAVEQGRFRQDLYYRLNGLAVTLPPLRQRRDRMALCAALIDQWSGQTGIGLAPAIAGAFDRYDWPGNLRQLGNVIQTACALLEPGETQIGWHHLPDDIAEELRAPLPLPPDQAAGGGDQLRAVTLTLLEQTVQQCGGNMSLAARRLGISRNTLYRKLRSSSGVA